MRLETWYHWLHKANYPLWIFGRGHFRLCPAHLPFPWSGRTWCEQSGIKWIRLPHLKCARGPWLDSPLSFLPCLPCGIFLSFSNISACCWKSSLAHAGGSWVPWFALKFSCSPEFEDIAWVLPLLSPFVIYFFILFNLLHFNYKKYRKRKKEVAFVTVDAQIRLWNYIRYTHFIQSEILILQFNEQ